MSRLNIGTGVGVRLGQVPAHRFVRNALRIRLRNSGTHLRVLCEGSPTLRGRLIESQPTLGLWVMSAADNGATVTAEQSDAPLWSRNLPPQLPNKALFKKFTIQRKMSSIAKSSA